MPLKRFIGKQTFQRGKLLGQLHFIVQVVNTVVTKPADIDAMIQHHPVEVFSEERTPVKFFGNQMMKCEHGKSTATCTISTFQTRR